MTRRRSQRIGEDSAPLMANLAAMLERSDCAAYDAMIVLPPGAAVDCAALIQPAGFQRAVIEELFRQ